MGVTTTIYLSIYRYNISVHHDSGFEIKQDVIELWILGFAYHELFRNHSYFYREMYFQRTN